MNIEQFIVQEDEKIIDVMKKINENSHGIVFLCQNRRLQAAVTDGDIRRYILKDGDLSKAVSEIANYNVVFLNQEDEKLADSIMRQHSITAIPVLYKDGCIRDIHFLTEYTDLHVENKPSLELPVVIMAGGKGTRLKPYTDILPKPLIPVGDRAITEYIMDRFSEYNCKHCYMIVNYKKEFIKAYFHDNECPRDIEFIEESQYLGTGGGLKLLSGQINETFFMSNCDIIVNADYATILESHKQHKNMVTMVCAKKNISIPYGTIQIDEQGNVESMKEKPLLPYLVNTGFYVIEPEFLDMIPQNTFIHLTEIIEKSIQNKQRVGAYIIDEADWMDMGQMDSMGDMRGRLGL